MSQISVNIKKQDVFDEVTRLVEYIGAKQGGSKYYDRVSLVDEDVEMLEQFFVESKNTLIGYLHQFFISESGDATTTLLFKVSPQYNAGMVGSISQSLAKFFVYNITAKWFSTVTKDVNVADLATMAGKFLEDTMVKLSKKCAPIRDEQKP